MTCQGFLNDLKKLMYESKLMTPCDLERRKQEVILAPEAFVSAKGFGWPQKFVGNTFQMMHFQKSEVN